MHTILTLVHPTDFRAQASYNANATTAAPAAAATAIDPPMCCAAPANAVDLGWPGAVGLLPFMEMLLTRSDGHGVASEAYAAERVIILSGAGDGQLVPQGATTVEVYRKGQQNSSNTKTLPNSP